MLLFTFGPDHIIAETRSSGRLANSSNSESDIRFLVCSFAHPLAFKYHPFNCIFIKKCTHFFRVVKSVFSFPPMSENELLSVACGLISCVIMLYTCRRKLICQPYYL